MTALQAWRGLFAVLLVGSLYVVFCLTWYGMFCKEFTRWQRIKQGAVLLMVSLILIGLYL